jgi:hypothetical protein
MSNSCLTRLSCSYLRLEGKREVARRSVIVVGALESVLLGVLVIAVGRNA